MNLWEMCRNTRIHLKTSLQQWSFVQGSNWKLKCEKLKEVSVSSSLKWSKLSVWWSLNGNMHKITERSSEFYIYGDFQRRQQILKTQNTVSFFFMKPNGIIQIN